VQAGTAIHGALDELEAVDVAFGGAVAIQAGEGVDDGVVVGLEAGNEAFSGGCWVVAG